MAVRAALLAVLLLGSCALLAAAAASSPRVSLESDVAVHLPKEWLDQGAIADHETVQLTFALKQRNTDVLLETLYAVSDPESPSYGQHMSFDEVSALVAPEQGVVNKVMAAVSDHILATASASTGAATPTFELSPSGDFLHASLPAAAASSLLDVPAFHRYTHVDDASQTYVRSPTHYTLPVDLAAHVDFVGGVSRLPTTNTHRGDLAEVQVDLGAGVTPMPPGTNAIAVTLIGQSLGLVLPRCDDGGVIYELGACHHASASSPQTIKFEATPVISAIGPQASASITVGSDSCKPCQDWATQVDFGGIVNMYCSAVAQQLNLHTPDLVVFCTVPIDNVAVAANNSITATTMFANNVAGTGGNTGYVLVEPTVTPQFIHNLYGMPADIKGTNSSNSQSVAEFLKQYYSPSDLASYLKKYNVENQIPVVVGPNVASDPGGEASLDIQVMLGVAPGIKTTFWSTAGLRNNSAPTGPSNQEPFMRWITAILASPDAPLVSSLSYSDAEHNMPETFTDRLNVEFMKAGVQGLTLFFATGDDGAPGGYLRTTTCKGFFPTFPPTSPYVTSVGGTQMTRGGAPDYALMEATSDTATGSIITSGGGFSRRYVRPGYQSTAVETYLKTAVLPPASLYNASGRAYPDISAIATNFDIFLNGTTLLIGGTSASTPTTASVFSLLNDARMNAGLGPLGWINPMLYALSSKNDDLRAFFDVTEGNNACSAIPTHCCPQGFTAAPGWDATTGIGTPRWAALLKLTRPLPVASKASVTSGAFKLQSEVITTPGGLPGPSTTLRVNISGVTNKQILSGTVHAKLYEDGVQHFVSSSSTPYFECTNKGCDPSKPIALHLAHPTSTPSAFQLLFNFVMPDSVQATGCYRMVVFGEDQDHAPYDFDATLQFNSTTTHTL